MEEIQPKGGGPSFPFGCERKEEKESDSASGTLGGPRIREGRWKRGVAHGGAGFCPRQGHDAPTPVRGRWLAALRGARLLRMAIRRGAGGNVGKRVPSGHNRRRRLATRSSGKQQAERTAVRAAPIVCPEESPPACIMGNNFAARNSHWRGLTRRLRREGRACSPMGRSHFSFGGERKVCKRKTAARRLPRRPAPLRVAGFVLR